LSGGKHVATDDDHMYNGDTDQDYVFPALSFIAQFSDIEIRVVRRAEHVRVFLLFVFIIAAAAAALWFKVRSLRPRLV
jgi:hypothetical protein